MRWPWSAPAPRLADTQADALLQALLSRDGARITDAAHKVAQMFDTTVLDALAAHGERIERSSQGLQFGGMLISNSVHLIAAVRRLRFWHARAGCLCTLNPGYLFFDPRHLIDQKQMQLLGLEAANDGWGECHHVACTRCGRHWRATDREYHYPWWQWIAD
ncbi:hypothetical protein [Xanthomonas arboricola]|uniref:hypothetical protein n=1 Tax=Xanthomonas arboricola TaxID=56448 RepID=UPI000CEE4478|nr:hypothetical protein [Xanthomonas arboricola]PPU42485.1 hypothetical protein XaplCFBP3123_05235 [Xanthomonas arboricola pv. populi]